MKKLILSIIACFCISFSYSNEKDIPDGLYLGDGSTTTEQVLPCYSYLDYSLTQQIYTSAELGDAGYIRSIAFFNGGAEKTRTLNFYLKNTTKSKFSNSSDWISVSASDLVFSGTVTMTVNEWTVINFDSPFFYDGTSNMVLVTDDNTGSSTYAPNMACRAYSAQSQSIYIYRFNTTFDPMNPSGYEGHVYYKKNQLILGKVDVPVQVNADYYPDNNDPSSPYVKVCWGTEINNVEDFEHGDFSMFNWHLDSNHPWTITTNDPYEGTYCMKSSNEGIHNSISSMECTVRVPNNGKISFFSKISSELNYDKGHFYIDGIEKGSYSGNISWSEKTYNVTAGLHTFKWTYQKDSSVNSNDDCFYVDYIRFYSSNSFAYDFEDSRLPAGWTTIDADGDGHNWMIASEDEDVGTGYGHNGSSDMVLSKSYYSGIALYPDNYLVSEQVTITNGSHFTFYACAHDINFASEHFGVFVSLGSNSNPNDFQEVQSWTMTSKGTRTQSTWHYYDVDLSAYAGTGYIAIRHYGCSDEYYLDVDDVSFSNSSKSGSTAYCIYRSKCDGSEMQMIAENVTGNQYIDTEWTNLSPGSYKYGVCKASSSGSKGGNRSAWDLLGSYECSSSRQYGIATDGKNIYHSTWTSNAGFMFAKYDMQGNFIEIFNVAGCGYLRDMTYDGQYFYGGTTDSVLYCVDLANKTLISTTTTSCNAIRCCAYDPVRDGFWVGNWSDAIQLIDRSGNVLFTGPEGISFSGAAYYMDENNVEHVYFYAQPNSSNAYIYDYDIASNTLSSSYIFSVSDNLEGATDKSGGCFIGYYDGKVAFFADVQQSPNLVGIFELKEGPFSWSNCIEKATSQQTIALSAGANWFSANVEITLADLQNALKATLGNNASITIKSQTQSCQLKRGSWTGSLTSMDVALMYKIVVDAACEFTLEGAPINPAEHPITINPGATVWIGYPLSEGMAVADAFTSSFIVNSDQLKSQTLSTQVKRGNWNGQLNTLEPGQGYIFKSASTGTRTFTFPASK